MDPGRIGEIALLEFPRDLRQVCAYQRDLRLIAIILGQHLLRAAQIRFREHMRRPLQAERHHLRAAPGDLVEPLPGGRFRGMNGEYC